MRDVRSLRWTGAALAMLALAGCSGDSSDYATPVISDNAEFVDLIDDARGEMRVNDLGAAGRMLEEARAIEPKNPAVWVDLARLRYRQGEQYEALKHLDRALALGPAYGPALFMRAQMVRDANGLADALPWYEAAIAADPRNPEVLADYAATLGDLGRNREMLRVVRQLQEVSPGYPQVFYLQAVLAARAEMPVLARSLLSKSGLIERGVPAAMLLDAGIDIQQQSPDTAVATLDALAKRQPANVRVRELLAKALWLSRRDDEMIVRFRTAVKQPDASPYLIMLVGRAYERRGDRAAAAPLIEQALAAQAAQLNALEAFAGLPEPTVRLRKLVRAGNADAAMAQGSELLQRFSGSSDMHALMGDAALYAGKAKAALALYSTASSVRRPWPITRKIITTTRALGDDKAADTLLVRAVLGEPRNTEALLMLAQRRAEFEDWSRVAKLANLVFALGAGNDPRVLDLQAQAAEALGRDKQAADWDLTGEAVRPSAFVRAK